ncbi:MAG TPA: nitrate reductase molybdenum cofactor assembly chaperone [Casimicrobiaceae bacterium]
MSESMLLRALGALLTYPRPELVAALPEIAAVLSRAGNLPAAERAALAALIAEMQQSDALELEERYVALFDRGRAASLNLFEHLHGDSRDRGPAMVALMDVYARAGFRLATKELPDFLPVVLEYLSCREHAEVVAMLADCAHILRSIGETLVARDSRYAAVFATLLAIAGAEGLDRSRGGKAAASEPALDDDWAEQPAFAPPADGSKARGSTMHFIPPRHG